MQFPHRPSQNPHPHPQNDLVQVNNSWHNINFSFGILEPCHHLNGKPRLVREKNAITSLSKPALVCTCPINTIYTDVMPKHNQHMDDVHLATLVQAIARSLGRYTVVMCTMGVSSSICGSLEAIEQVTFLNIAVFAMRHDVWTSTIWSIFRTPCC